MGVVESGLESTEGSEQEPDSLIGRKFGRWEVVARTGSRQGKSLWKCRCECGAEQNILRHNLVCGNSKGCRQCGLKASRQSRVKWNFGKYARVPYGTNRPHA